MPEAAADARAARALSGPRFTLGGTAPQIARSAFVAPTAAVIGDVVIGEHASVWFHCVLRGDTNFIRVGARTNLQDGTIVHVNAGQFPCVIGDDVTIGHAAIVHACTLKDRAFVGMGACVLDGAVIEEGGMLGAGALLPPRKRIGPGELWMGHPARLVRMLGPAEREEFGRIAGHYVELAARYLAELGSG